MTAVFVVRRARSASFLLYRSAKSELAPQEDQSFVVTQSTYAPDATLQQQGSCMPTQAYGILQAQNGSRSTYFKSTRRACPSPACPAAARSTGAGSERRSSAAAAEASARSPAQRSSAFQPPSLPGAFGLPVQFAIKTTEPAAAPERRLAGLSRRTRSRAACSCSSTRDLKYDLPQSVIEIDRDKAAQLDLTMSQVGSALSSLLGRRLRQLLQHADTLLQGHSAGRTRVALERRSTAQLSDRDHQRQFRCRCRRSPRSAPRPFPKRSITFSS